MMLLSGKTRGLGRKGIVMFVVLGAILVLGVLVFSYNFFVRGKFNESREILMHLRASKCAQATSSYVFTHLLSDLQASSDDTNAGDILRQKVFVSNSESDLSELIKKEWFDKIDCNSFVHSLLDETVGKAEISYDVEFGFTDIKTLDSLKDDENVFFFPMEKVGRLTIRVTIMIDHTREIWQETRPFKVVTPFPTPLTKFSFYWKDGTDVSDPYCFNTVIVDPDSGKPVNGSKYPFIFDNGSSVGDNNQEEDLWKYRGWIYVGGSDLCLNRTCGDTKYGQHFYSYPRGNGFPSTLMLDFNGGDYWDNYPLTNKNSGSKERLGFRVAHWGFSEAVVKNATDNMWKNILKGEFEEYPYDSNKNYWQSSSLHLFSEVNALDDSSSASNFVPTITRVIGKVHDRFLELGYLLPTNSSTSIFAAVINYFDKSSFDEAAKNTSSSGNTANEPGGVAEYTFENFLFFKNGFNYSVENMEAAEILQDYFCNSGVLQYSDTSNPNALAYHHVMSKILMRGIDETYDVIAAYSVDTNGINLPPAATVPRTTEMSFNPTSREVEMGVLPDSMKDLRIDKIGEVEDTTLGLNLRACYVIDGTSEEIQNALLTEFGGSNANGHGLNLNNLVYKIKSKDDTANLGSNISIKTPGTIFSEGPISLGSFVPSGEPDKAPLMVLAGRGAISIDNAGENDIRAYLVALGEEGTVKANNAGAPLNIRGGMAVKTFSPDNLPNAGGHLVYNLNLDPTNKDGRFTRFFGVAFGPKGGRL